MDCACALTYDIRNMIAGIGFILLSWPKVIRVILLYYAIVFVICGREHRATIGLGSSNVYTRLITSG